MVKGWKRTNYCGEVGEELVGKELVVMGWVAKARNLGSLIFVDVRDQSGILQIVFDEKATDIRTEYVIAVQGKLRIRESVNEKMKTGRVELVASEYMVLSEAETTPFFINDTSDVNEALKLKYRYLDLRTPYLSEKIMQRSRIAKAVRDFLSSERFLEIETPFLGRSTPEGARDYLVPSRVHPGKFYALPQSPQLYKQLLMISGFDRYYQIVKCFRDEDLRSNRQPEFTQIDIEMAFTDNEEDVMQVSEQLIRTMFSECLGVQFDHAFPRYTYEEAMRRFGSDKPDTRFGMELTDVTDLVRACGLRAFSENASQGSSTRLINAKGFAKADKPLLSRKDIDGLGEFVKTYQAKGLFWGIVKEEGFQSSLTKFLSEDLQRAILERADAEAGDVLLFVSDADPVVFAALGALRLKLGHIGNLCDPDRYDILWVTEFPMFEFNEEDNRLYAKHHPFTAPKDEDLHLLESDPLKVRTKAYDLVINGQEAGGGSVRIYQQDLQKQVFGALGFSQQDILERFGFFIEAFRFGTPPHGGIAFGLDRLAMLMTKTDNIKDVIAFPKVQNASDLMTQAPNVVEEKQLDELNLTVKKR